ncbi:MAG: hypothetical protein WCI49_09385 [Ferruginibacter sp.]
MPIPTKYLADFEENGIYHVYNRTNNKDLLFITDENRVFFLKRYKGLLTPFTDTYCWCLLPNHFHLLIRIKSEADIKTYLQYKPKEELTVTEKKYLEGVVMLSELIEQSFKRFFQSYALAFNKQHKRRGNLFYKSFKRVLIDKDVQFTMAIIYIHANAAKHKLVKNFTTYQWSSWHSIASNQETAILRKEIIDWFGSIEACIKTHVEMAAYYFNCEVAIEE